MLNQLVFDDNEKLALNYVTKIKCDGINCRDCPFNDGVYCTLTII